MIYMGTYIWVRIYSMGMYMWYSMYILLGQGVSINYYYYTTTLYYYTTDRRIHVCNSTLPSI